VAAMIVRMSLSEVQRRQASLASDYPSDFAEALLTRPACFLEYFTWVERKARHPPLRFV
jgi:hypothetical protein